MGRITQYIAKVIFLFTWILFAKDVAAQGFQGGPYTGTGNASLFGGTTASNLAKGGSFDGSSLAINGCTPPSNLSAGGSFDGSSSGINSCTTSSTLAAGGSFDGSSSGFINCSLASNVVASGGSYDGGSMLRLSSCSSPGSLVLSGGSFTGSSLATLASCTAPSNPAAGGSYDGSSLAINGCTPPSNLSAGGSFDGSSSGINSCTTSLTLAAGGSFDGSSSGFVNCSLASNVVASGGSYDGGSMLRLSSCSSPGSLVLSGGSFTGSSLATLASCTAPSNPAAGGSYDGASLAINGCTPPSNLSAGGSFDGSSSGINSCTTSLTLAAGGSFDGSSSGFVNCSLASNVVASGGSYDGAARVNISCISFYVASIGSTPAACSCSGTTSVTAAGGAIPISYLWSNGATTSTTTGLCPGVYSVTITDAIGNRATGSVAVGSSVSTLVTSVSSVSSTCGYSNGSASISVSGGTPPYSYSWSSGATSATVTSLAQGSYTVTVTDNGGCTSINVAVVSNVSGPSVTISSQTNVSCYGGNNGSATASVSSGTSPFTYNWDTSPVQTTATANNLFTGNYTVTVTDANSCIQTASVTITSPSAISAVISSQTDVGCYGGSDGSLTVNPSGGSIPYIYTWNSSPIQTTATASNLTAGVYTVTIKDANNCSSTVTATITEPALLSVSAFSNTPVCYGANINLTSSPSGGTTAYVYSWSGPASYSSTDANPTIAFATTANSGTYFLTVTDAHGCSATASTAVTVIICTTTLNLNVFIEGYYIAGGQMQPTVLNESVPTATGAETDTIYVLLHDIGNPAIVSDSVSAILMTDGTATAIFNGTATGNSYWIAIKHRNTVETWSNSIVYFNPVTNYDFTSAATQAYGNNMIQVEFSPDLWAAYNGDINQDQNVDLLDFPDMDYGINNGLYGYYNTDLNGDGNVDLLDFPTLDANINNGIYSIHP